MGMGISIVEEKQSPNLRAELADFRNEKYKVGYFGLVSLDVFAAVFCRAIPASEACVSRRKVGLNC